MRVGLQQRVVAHYRADFLGRLAEKIDGSLSVYGGRPRRHESLSAIESIDSVQLIRGRNLHLFRGGAYVCLQPGLISWLRAYDPDVLILAGNPRLLSNWRATRWMRRRGRPVLAWGLWAPRQRKIMVAWRWLWHLFARQFDGYIMYGDQHAEECVRLGLPPSRVFVAPNAVKPPADSWSERNPGTRPLTVLFVGRLEPRKRVDILIRACATVKPVPDLWIVGDGPDRNNLENTAMGAANVRFWGALYGESLAARFLNADLLVLPGTGGLAVQEAMSYGLPVAVAEADGTQLDLVTPENGWLLEPGNMDQLQSVLQAATDDPHILQRMGEESLKIVQSRVNLDVMVRGFIKALTELGPAPETRAA